MLHALLLCSKAFAFRTIHSTVCTYALIIGGQVFVTMKKTKVRLVDIDLGPPVNTLKGLLYMPIPLVQHVLNRHIAHIKFVFKTHGQLFWTSGTCIISNYPPSRHLFAHLFFVQSIFSTDFIIIRNYNAALFISTPTHSHIQTHLQRSQIKRETCVQDEGGRTEQFH